MEKAKHVPFRNSTLTFLLSESLSGDSKTLMFVNLSPVLINSDESICSLNFASRVRNVELGKAKSSVRKTDAAET
jgi:kinesin family protein C2/C3